MYKQLACPPPSGYYHPPQQLHHTTPHPLGRFVSIVIYNTCIVGSGKMAKNDDKTKGLEEENCNPSFNL